MGPRHEDPNPIQEHYRDVHDHARSAAARQSHRFAPLWRWPQHRPRPYKADTWHFGAKRVRHVENGDPVARASSRSSGHPSWTDTPSHFDHIGVVFSTLCSRDLGTLAQWCHRRHRPRVAPLCLLWRCLFADGTRLDPPRPIAASLTTLAATSRCISAFRWLDIVVGRR